VAVAQEEALEPVPGPGAVRHRVEPGAGQVSDGLVGLVGDMDGGQLAGTVQASQLHGVAAIGLLVRTRWLGNLRGGDDDAVDPALLHPAVQDEAGRAGFIGHVQLERLATDLGDQPLKRVQGVGCRTIAANLPATAGFGDGDNDRILVDIEAHVMLMLLHVLVSVFGC
jgi:hypothetical protein